MAPEQPRRSQGNFARQFAMAMELPFVLVGGVFAGGLLGYFLDRWWGTRPYLMLGLGALGFYVGVRDLLRRLQRNDENGPGEEKR